MENNCSSVLPYAGGEIYPALFNCGSGMKEDFSTPTGEDSFMHIVKKTSLGHLRQCRCPKEVL